MTTTNVIVILLFIIPGILAEKISYKIDFPTGKKRSDFAETLNGIALSFPILFLVAIFIRFKYNFDSLPQYIRKMDSMDFLFEISTYILLVSIFTGVLISPFKSLLRNYINLFRTEKMKTDDKTCWRKFLIDENASKFLEIIKDGRSYKGFMGPFSLPDESKEIIVYTPKTLLNNKDYDADTIFKKIKSTYIDLEKNIVVHDYDMKEYEEWCDEQDNKTCPAKQV